MTSYQSIFTKYAVNLLEKDFKKTQAALKDHPQIPLVLDTLSRQKLHHITLTSLHSTTLNRGFMEGVAHHISTAHLPFTLRHVYFILFDIAKLALNPSSHEQIAHDFHVLADEINTSDKRIIFALTDIEPLVTTQLESAVGFLGQLIKSVLTHDKWRIMAFSASPFRQKNTSGLLTPFFSQIKLSEVTYSDSLALLKELRPELEGYHHALISDEAFKSAYALASHYLPGQCHFDKASQLLDSGTAYATLHDKMEQSTHKNIVTTQLLTQLISNWTQIPLSHLQQNKFQANRLTEALQKKIFGQDAAIESISLLLQNACLKLQDKKGPLSSLILAGPADVGKTETAFAIAEHLYGHKNALFRVILTKTNYQSLSEINVVTSMGHQTMNLLEAIQQIPYAIILIEHIDQIPSSVFDLFKDIFIQGYVYDEKGCQYYFHHAIIIMTTRLGTENITQLSPNKNPEETTKAVDLMQLVLTNPIQNETTHHSHFSLQELNEMIIPALETQFSSNFIQQTAVIPFVPLTYAAIEKIIRLKLKGLVRQLDLKFDIELHYVPEVVKFLAYDIFWHNTLKKSLEQLLEENLYATIAHIILTTENKTNSKRLLLQLNDSGQLLRCEFVTAADNTLYNL